MSQNPLSPLLVSTGSPPLRPPGAVSHGVTNLISPSSRTRSEHVSTDSSLSSLLRVAWPLVLSSLLQAGSGILILIFTGHLPEDESVVSESRSLGSDSDGANSSSAIFLAAAALANMYATVTGYSTAFGILTPVDTLGSQAFGVSVMEGLDSEDREYYQMQVGLVVQRMGAIVGILLVFVILLWVNCHRVLLLLGQDELVASYAQIYITCLIPDLPFQVGNQMLDSYLTVQTITKPIFYIAVVTFPVQILLSTVFIGFFELGFWGAPLAQGATSAAMFCIRVALISWKGVFKRSWPPLSWDIFDGWGPILELGLPGLVMICLSWWSLELAAIAAGWIGKKELAAWVTIVGIFTVFYMVPVGLHNAGMTLIGNSLGSGNPQMAKTAANNTILLSIFFNAFQAVFLFFTQNVIGFAFTSDPSVASYISTLIPLLIVMLFFETLQCVLSAILQAMGKQNIGAAINFIGYYVIGLPLGIVLLKYFGMEIHGIVWGLTVASIFNCIVYSTQIVKVDWEFESKLAQQRILEEEEQEKLVRTPLLLGLSPRGSLHLDPKQAAAGREIGSTSHLSSAQNGNGVSYGTMNDNFQLE